ncbi:NAD-dependent epimerase/dehydratase family protein [Sphingomonas sanguinis]|uniref:NAD-dependent epimerase/dehydratase family protein n=1 Tax=Sphingomonas sanguinis TaxID=33051 RepID=UPI0027D8F3E7|nr:NAD-dependent epimerase/dehydratase family protein [Sphingomonas sanguinis]
MILIEKTPAMPPNDRPQRLLLLGGTGFIGVNLSHALIASGHDVLVAGRRTQPDRVAAGARPVAIGLGDVEDLVALITRERIDTVVHLVSGMKPSSTLADYLVERETVLTPALRLADALAELGTRLVYFSSGGTVYGMPSGDHAEEADPCEPISFYGRSKLEMETHLRFLQRTRGLRSLIVRPSNPYGPHQALNGAQGLVSVLFGRIAEQRGLEVWGDGSSVRDYIHIDDLTATTCALIGRGYEGTVNAGSGEGHSLLDVVRIVEQVTGREIPLSFRPPRAVDVPRLVLAIDRLRGMGLHRSRPLAQGIRDYAVAIGLIDAAPATASSC